jgi:hypothetical protein
MRTYEFSKRLNARDRPYDGEFRASIAAAKLTAFGATCHESRRNLADLASATMEMCATVGPDRLGPGPARQFKALQTVLGAR